jgi:hypothetical protein
MLTTRQCLSSALINNAATHHLLPPLDLEKQSSKTQKGDPKVAFLFEQIIIKE